MRKKFFFFLVKQSEERGRVAPRGGCQLQTNQTRSGRDMAVSSHSHPPPPGSPWGSRGRSSGSARPGSRSRYRPSFGVDGCHFAPFFFSPPPQRGCSLITTSAFYNMAAQRGGEEEACWPSSRNFVPLGSALAHGLSTGAVWSFSGNKRRVCPCLKGFPVEMLLIYHVAPSVAPLVLDQSGLRVPAGPPRCPIALLPAGDAACAPQAGLHPPPSPLSIIQNNFP